MSGVVRMKYPYTVLGKFVNFPWKWHWQNGRFLRYLTYGFILSYPVFYKIHAFVNGPGNVQMWKEIREKRYHDKFAPVHD